MPHLESFGWIGSFSIVKTKRMANAPAFRGGVSSWGKLETEIRLLLKDASIDLLATVIDYYGIPAAVPGMASRPGGGSPVQLVTHVGAAVAAHIGNARFVPHLTLHEVEAWVFAAGWQLADLRSDPKLARAAVA
jgi:hypothetical protein